MGANRGPSPSDMNNFIKHDFIQQELLDEYIKHELIEQVNISDTGTIYIMARKRYIYPKDFEEKLKKIQKQLKQSFIEIQTELNQCGIPLPEPQFVWAESIFLESHPYLTNTD